MRYVYIPYLCVYAYVSKYKPISPLKHHLMSYFYHCVACGVDKYPRNMPCRKTHACSKLAARRGCNKRFSQILPRWCWQKLSAKDRRQLVKNYCRKSCRNCLGKCQNEFFLTKEKSNNSNNHKKFNEIYFLFQDNFEYGIPLLRYNE